MSADPVTIPVVSINLIGGHNWVDLLSGQHFRPHAGEITFAPYQCRWISNRG